MVQWYRVSFSTRDVWWGRRVPFPASHAGYDTTNYRFLADHAGAWSCDLRMDGQVLRNFAFTVNADGRIATHAEQTGAQAYKQLGGLSLIEVRIPSPSPGDEYVDPAAIRGAFQFGQPRRQAAAWAASLSTLPAAAVGRADPTNVPGFSAGAAAAAGGGRRRRGR